MTIILSQNEYEKLKQATEVLDKYSRVYSEIVKGESGMCHDVAGTALNAINSILKESSPH